MQLKFKILFFLTLMHTFSYSQNRTGGIRLLARDKETGVDLINDTLIITINDSIQEVLVSDNEGYSYLKKNEGIYSIKVFRHGYKKIECRRVKVTENSTSNLTLELDRDEPPSKKKKMKNSGVKLKRVN